MLILFRLLICRKQTVLVLFYSKITVTSYSGQRMIFMRSHRINFGHVVSPKQLIILITILLNFVEDWKRFFLFLILKKITLKFHYSKHLKVVFFKDHFTSNLRDFY